VSELDERIAFYLQQRIEKSLFRELPQTAGKIDFSSNDYLGFSRSAFLFQQVQARLTACRNEKMGAGGSRLLSGNSALQVRVEELLAAAHHGEAALLFNSGFDANAGLISTVARPGDLIFYDEFVHASIHQGMKLSGARTMPFRHNDLSDLENKIRLHLNHQTGFVITESVFSMEGDKPALKQLAVLSEWYGLKLIIDEAHATGVFGENGSGLCNEASIEHKCFARVYTFGKALGCHGGAVIGSRQLKDYLVNFCRNFIYTTALPTDQLLRVKHAYLMLQQPLIQRVRLKNLISYFRSEWTKANVPAVLTGEGPIFGLMIAGNERCRNAAAVLQKNGFEVRPILSPTVSKGTERLRIILHSFNTSSEVDRLIDIIKNL
jgi:8-amino-7-oxononanoate synthase